jgi:hypothetical protein
MLVTVGQRPETQNQENLMTQSYGSKVTEHDDYDRQTACEPSSKSSELERAWQRKVN